MDCCSAVLLTVSDDRPSSRQTLSNTAEQQSSPSLPRSSSVFTDIEPCSCSDNLSIDLYTKDSTDGDILHLVICIFMSCELIFSKRKNYYKESV